MNKLSAFLPLVLFAVFAAALDFGLNRDPSFIPSVVIDRKMPNFALPPLKKDGNGFSLEDLSGRVTLVNIFASWCGVCGVEHPTLMRLSRERAIAIFGVDWKDAPSDGTAWIAKNGNPYERTGSDENGRLAIDLGVTGAPETFVVDRTGRIRYKQVGAITTEIWQEKLAPMIAKLEKEQ
jgi:cytochrome c biogenesis protein CcmG, thiol:disulfide interchange protein DsbE